jgi:hypothetical protein
MERTGSAVLHFNPRFDLSARKRLRDGLSGVVQIGRSLWVANDETLTLERLSFQEKNADGSLNYGEHAQFALKDYLRLPAPPPDNPKDPEEADLEGLAYQDDYLWLVGSHSLKRKYPKEGMSAKENLQRLEKVKSDGNRFLLARIPVVEENGSYTLKQTALRGDQRLVAAQLRGNDRTSDLLEALRSDSHLAPFLAIPGKDNGLDLEGLAVAGPRIFIGLRGPVLRGWAMILELEVSEEGDDRSVLRLKKGGRDRRPYRKHFLQFCGLGVRDLCVDGSDLLILAGPTMDLDGPVTVFRWPGGARSEGEGVVFAKELPVVLQVPYGQGERKGTDHAEGMTLFNPEGGSDSSLLMVYDAAAKDRKQGDDAVEADFFSLG